MTPAKAEQLRAIFDEAAERPESERAAFVHSACGGDAGLEREVLSLLAAMGTGSSALDVDAGRWLAVGSADGAEGPRSPEDEHAASLFGEVVGDFRLIRSIGRGAMGSVYEAEQISVKRRVAVKLLQSWTASRDSRRRFIEESVTLAKLTHPGIAHVIAAGTRTLNLSGPDQALAAGIFNDLHSLPWIAMELVEGARTIFDWSRENAGATSIAGQAPAPRAASDIVGMFATVCDALQHGHQQDIIHRDLKPANILVNDRGEPKIIDFGIARAIGAHPAAASGNTLVGKLLGSPRYMSPEQCEGGGASVDTRSDVYSLGVVLYEALTGKMPYDVDDTAIAACMSTICQVTAADPRSVAPHLPKDIAAVVLKALDKRPAERYQSASDFAADLRRVLHREPITARKASWSHRAVLLVRRRPVMSALVLVAMLGIIAGVVGISVGLANERVARREAERSAWLANLTAADSYLREGNGGMARRRLDAIPESRRGWEWHLLYAKSDTSAAMWKVTDAKGLTFMSPSGRTALLHNHETLRCEMYDVATRQLICEFDGKSFDGRPAWSPDERRIIMGRDNELVIADSLTGEVLRRIPIPVRAENSKRSALGPSMSPDGTLIATGIDADVAVMVFKVDTGECVFSRASEVWVFNTAFSPDGRTIAWCGERGVEIVDTQTWTNTYTIPVPRPAHNEQGWLAYSPDGRTLALGFGRDAYLINPASGSIRAVLRGHAQRIHSVSFDKASERLITTSIDRTVRVWNVADGSPGPVLLGHESPTSGASFIKGAPPREQSILSVDMGNRLRSWVLESGTPVFSTMINECRSHITHLEFTPDQSTLTAVDDVAYAEITLEPTPRLSLERSYKGTTVRAVPALRLVVGKAQQGGLFAERVDSGERVWSASCEHVRGGFCVSPRGGLIAVSEKTNIVLLSAHDGAARGSINAGHTAHSLIFSQDETLLASLGFEGEVNIWETKTGALVEKLAPIADRGAGLAWNADASWIIYCHAIDGVTIWDRNAQRVVTRIDNVGGYVWSLALSPDGTRLAVGAQDRICHIYDIPSGDEVLQLRDHVGSVMSVAWSPDGRMLATGGYDKRVIIYQSPSDPGQASSRR